MRHIVRVDFSKNSISELPPNFGDLVNLQHLDLLGNKLEILPVSFWQLRKLKWLDLKDNPLDEGLKKAAGDCLDDVQCRRCAQQVCISASGETLIPSHRTWHLTGTAGFLFITCCASNCHLSSYLGYLFKVN